MKRFLIWAVGIVLVLVAAVAAIPLFLDVNQFRPLLESKLSEALGREVKAGEIKLELMAGKLSVADLSIGEDPAFGKEPFLKAANFRAAVELRPLIFDRQVNITAVAIDKPALRLVMSPKGDWNFASLGKKQAAGGGSESNAQASPIGKVEITDGTFTLVRPGVRDQTVSDIDLEASNVAANAAMPFKISAKRNGGGSIQAEGTAGPLTPDAALPPLNAKFRMAALDVNAAGLVDASTGVAGVLGLTGEAKTKDNVIEVSGALHADKVKLVREGKLVAYPVEVTFAAQHNIAKASGRLSRADIRTGKAAATLAGTYSLAGKAASFNFKFAGDKMPLAELAGLLPALNIAIPQASKIEAGTLTISSTVSGSTGYFSAIGPITLEAVKLTNFDLGKEMRVIQTLARIPQTPATEISLGKATVKHTPEGTLVDGLSLDVSGIGALNGSGTIDPENRLNFRMNAMVKGSLLSLVAMGKVGDVAVPFLIQGTSENPVFKPDVKALAQQSVQQFAKDPVSAVNKAKELFESGDLFGIFKKKKQE